MNRTHTPCLRPLLAAISFAGIHLLGSTPLVADSIFDYKGFGVRDAILYGFPTIGTVQAIATLAPVGVSSFSANHLATDAARNRVLFTASGSVTELYAWNFGTDSIESLGIISQASSLTDIHTSSGGAAFYSGAYYFFDDSNTGDLLSYGLTRVTFKADGTVDTYTKPYGNADPGTGGLGDIAISPEGILYLHSTDRSLWKLDLNNPLATFQLIRTGTGAAAGQLFFDSQGRLLGRGDNGVGWFVFNTTTGATTRINTSSAHTFSDLSDAPDVPPAPIPEPSIMVSSLIGAAALLTVRRLRRTRKA